MPKVEREHEPRTWSAWAVTRTDFAALVDEAARLVHEETRGPTTFDIHVPGFERSFTTTAEFLESVAEEDWTAATRSSLVLLSGEYGEEERMFVFLDVWTFLSTNGVELRLKGRNRRSRNAVEPDLVRLIDKHKRRSHGFGRTMAIAMAPIHVVLFATAALLILALDPSLIASIAIWLVCYTVPSLAIVKYMVPWVDRITRPVELLPDSGISIWDAAWKAKTRQATVAVTVLGAIGAIATVLAVVVDLLK
jgi:hypothetical protein